LNDERLGSNTNSTQYTSEYACPTCGVGLCQKGPLILKLIGSKQRKMFCVSLRHSNEWVISAEAGKLLKGFSGFRFGEVYTSEKAKQPSEKLKQVIIENRLPRMATLTTFSEYDPPMENKCSCNRAGWNLLSEKIYERSALKAALDFNLTVERWYGGGLAGLNWPIVSQQVRRVILDNKLLSRGCFEPVRIIEKDPGNKYQFDLPFDSGSAAADDAGVSVHLFR
jgi:hypothetical protein